MCPSGTVGGPVLVRYTKWGGMLHWHFAAALLGEDDHGIWLGAPAGTPVQRGFEAPITSGAFVLLVPPDRWWTSVWNDLASPFSHRVYADICTPAIWSGDMVSMADLDLDVVTDAAGRVAIHDEDEFADHAQAWRYPAAVATHARIAADTLAGRMRSGSAPFDGTDRRWLQQARTLP